jgi:hypothetical protein
MMNAIREIDRRDIGVTAGSCRCNQIRLAYEWLFADATLKCIASMEGRHFADQSCTTFQVFSPVDF